MFTSGILLGFWLFSVSPGRRLTTLVKQCGNLAISFSVRHPTPPMLHKQRGGLPSSYTLRQLTATVNHAMHRHIDALETTASLSVVSARRRPHVTHQSTTLSLNPHGRRCYPLSGTSSDAWLTLHPAFLVLRSEGRSNRTCFIQYQQGVSSGGIRLCSGNGYTLGLWPSPVIVETRWGVTQTGLTL